MKKVDPLLTSRAYAYNHWLHAPMPMVTFFKDINVAPLLKFSRKHHLRFNMLMCWCIGIAAAKITEFYTLPVGDDLIQYDSIAIGAIVANEKGGINSCDVPFSENLDEFNRDYCRLVDATAHNCTNHDLRDSMVIGTSNLASYEIDGAVGMYSGIYNNPFLIWSKYTKSLFKEILKISFQFHHVQMDGAHAARFLCNIQTAISSLSVRR